MSASLSAPVRIGARAAAQAAIDLAGTCAGLMLEVLSLLPLAYVGLKAWQAGWAEALHLLWRPYVFGLPRNTLALMSWRDAGLQHDQPSLAWLLERSSCRGDACGV